MDVLWRRLRCRHGGAGSGKTTLLECIALRNRSFRGSVKYDGHMPSGEFVCTHSGERPSRAPLPARGAIWSVLPAAADNLSWC